MPNRDWTGPRWNGPMTWEKRGKCAWSNVSPMKNGIGGRWLHRGMWKWRRLRTQSNNFVKND